MGLGLFSLFHRIPRCQATVEHCHSWKPKARGTSVYLTGWLSCPNPRPCCMGKDEGKEDRPPKGLKDTTEVPILTLDDSFIPVRITDTRWGVRGEGLQIALRRCIMAHLARSRVLGNHKR